MLGTARSRAILNLALQVDSQGNLPTSESTEIADRIDGWLRRNETSVVIRPTLQWRQWGVTFADSYMMIQISQQASLL
jgi:hypothetical protein